jgi:ABC-type amino acid transport system permease subunit
MIAMEAVVVTVAIAVAVVLAVVAALAATAPVKMTTLMAVTRIAISRETQFLVQVCHQLLQRSLRTDLPSSLWQAKM